MKSVATDIADLVEIRTALAAAEQVDNMMWEKLSIIVWSEVWANVNAEIHAQMWQCSHG